MQQTIIQVVTALLGSLGFAFMFNLGKRNVIPAAVNGMCTWIVYILVRNIIDDVFIPSLAASLWAAIYAEIAARIMKAPAKKKRWPSCAPVCVSSCGKALLPRICARA